MEPRKGLKQIIQIKLSKVKKPNWLEANQLAINFTNVVKDSNWGLPRSNPANVRAVMELRAAELQVQCSHPLATLIVQMYIV